MIRSLQTFRGLFAISLFLVHYGTHYDIFNKTGDLMLTFYMMLSGFVLAYAERKRDGSSFGESYWSFVRRRIRRIYPVYLLALVACVFLNEDLSFSIDTFLIHAAMLQSWFPNIEMFYGYNGPAWFVSSLMFCLLLFPIVYWLMINRIKIFVGGGTAMVVIHFAIACGLDDAQVPLVVGISPVTVLPTFMLGMLLSRLTMSRPVRIAKPLHALAAMLSAFAILGVAIWGSGRIPERYLLCSYWWIPVAVFIAGMTIVDSTECAYTKLLHVKPIVWLGNVTLYVYMLQMPAIYIMKNHILTHMWLGYNVQRLLCFGMLVAVAALLDMILRKKMSRELSLTPG